MARQVQVDADLAFSITPAATGRRDGGARPVSGTVRAAGTHITVSSDDVLALSTTSAGRSVDRVATELARRGFTLSLAGPRGPVVTIGAVPRPFWHRVVTRSRHVRVDDWREAWRIRQAQRRQPGAQDDDAVALPPPTPFPLAPTFRRLRRPVTTTHDPAGGGRPQLVLSMGATPTRDSRRLVFRLPPGVTTIGSSDDVDLRLDGLAPLHAEVRRDDQDEYVLVPLASDAVTLVNGGAAPRHVLRAGARIQLGQWRMSYWRDEHADHGRPFGGREGGELSHQRPQQRPEYRVEPPAR